MMHRLIRQTEVELRTAGGFLRREFLRTLPWMGATGALWSWPDWVAAQSAQLRRQHKHCILLWMQGGPSQFETFTPLEGHANAGETRSAATCVAGIRVAEHLPRLAQSMDKLCLIRSLTSTEGSHPRATFLLHTGYLPNPSVRHPSFGAITAQQLGEAAEELPSFVRIGGRGGGGPGAGMLGVNFEPLQLPDPSRPPQNSQPATDTARFRRRLALVENLNDQYAVRGAVTESEEQTQLYRKTARMILSSHMRVFDLQSEPLAQREAYGDTDFGRGCLMARRLVEAGVTFVEVHLGNWDTHEDNFVRTRQLCGQLDQPFAQLLTDLEQRGLLDDTLVIWMGEFGRTPRVNPRAGRDHFPRAFTVALAGGGVRGGQVIGWLNRAGTEIEEQPVTVQDLLQTCCHLLRIDPDHENMAPAGRPLKIVDGGQPISQVWTASTPG